MTGDPPTEGVWLGRLPARERRPSAWPCAGPSASGEVVGHHVKELLRSLLPLGSD